MIPQLRHYFRTTQAVYEPDCIKALNFQSQVKFMAEVDAHIYCGRLKCTHTLFILVHKTFCNWLLARNNVNVLDWQGKADKVIFSDRAHSSLSFLKAAQLMLIGISTSVPWHQTNSNQQVLILSLSPYDYRKTFG